MAQLAYFGPKQKDEWHPPMAMSNAQPPFQDAEASNIPGLGLAIPVSAQNRVATAQAPMQPKIDQTPAYQSPAGSDKGRQSAQAALGGMQAAGGVQATADPLEAGASVLNSTAQGALMGFMAGGKTGGPMGAAIGGGIGLVLGGLNAFLGMRAARKQRDQNAAIRAEAEKRDKEQRAEDEKWRIINRLDSIEEAKYQRGKFAMQQAYKVSQDQGQAMMSLIASNAQLKDRFAKFGY